jgi:hypothetical protein
MAGAGHSNFWYNVPWDPGCVHEVGSTPVPVDPETEGKHNLLYTASTSPGMCE